MVAAGCEVSNQARVHLCTREHFGYPRVRTRAFLNHGLRKPGTCYGWSVDPLICGGPLPT